MEMDDCPALCCSVVRASVCSKKGMDYRLSNQLPNGMVIPQLRLGVFSHTPPHSLRLYLPIFLPLLADTFGVKDLGQGMNE